MASPLLIAILFTTSIPAEWDRIPAWIDSSTQEEILESVENGNPQDPRAIRTLDLTLRNLRLRTQFYLLRSIARRFEQKFPETPLGIQALAWRCWMLPEGMTGEDDQLTLQGLAEGSSFPEIWFEVLQKCPDDISGIMAAKLIRLSRSESWNKRVDQFIAEQPESGVSAMMMLEKGTDMANHQDWVSAVDAWFLGMEKYPIDWELPYWSERLKEGLMISGQALQAEIVSSATPKTLQQLRMFREALAASNRGETEVAISKLEALAKQGIHSSLLEELIASHLDALEIQIDASSKGSGLIASVATVPAKDLIPILDSILVEVDNPALAGRLLSIANVRFDRGEYREAVCIWQFLTKHFQENEVVPVEAYRRLIEIRGNQYSLLRDLEIPESEKGYEGYFRPLLEEQRKKCLIGLEEVLDKGERFAANLKFSLPTLELLKTLYRTQSHRGYPDRPADLFFQLALRSNPEQRSAIAKTAERYRPREALAIIEIGDGSQSTELSSLSPESLLSLFEHENRYSEAAAIAREIAEEASGTPYANDAWFKTANLEYKAKDFESATETLTKLLNDLEEGTPDHTEANRMLGLSQYQTGDYENARKHFDNAIESGLLRKDEQENLAVLSAYSLLYHQRYEEAREQLNWILEHDPSRITERKVSRLIGQIDRKHKDR